jgi:hypothetical protein
VPYIIISEQCIVTMHIVVATCCTMHAGDDDAVGMLPCAHTFHTECIQAWLVRENRCPVCRQAAHGIDRVLEIVF